MNNIPSSDCRKEESMKKTKLTALYERLSHDDEQRQGDSLSIAHQKSLLEDYAATHGLGNCVHFTDDGISGLRFDRPGYLAMMEAVEAGQVEVVIIKDTSRLGRDHLRVGLCMETLRQCGVRLIAINDGLDTINGEDDFTPFRTIMHEFYARDTSRKIKSAYQAKNRAGKHLSGLTPYGYLKSADDKQQWVVDEEAAAVVRHIFQMTLEGKGPYQICCILQSDKVLIPGAHMAKYGAGLHQKTVFQNPYRWCSSTVCGILKKREYLGHTVNFKTRKHFKDKKSHYVNEREWSVIENTHEAIIDEETFDNVQRIRGGIKRRPDGWGYVHPLSGLLFCADCGGKLYVHRIYNGKDKPQYVCGNYTKADDRRCPSAHRIDASTVAELIVHTLKAISDYAKTDRAAFIKSVQERLATRQTSEMKKQKRRLLVCEKRTADLELLIRKVYEDNALGKLPDMRYEALSRDYEAEQVLLEREMAELRSAVDCYEDGAGRAASFIKLANRHADFEVLTVPMLHEFVEKIIVYERDRKGGINSTQKVEIHLNFIGEYLPPIAEISTHPEQEEFLTPEQEAAQRKKKETKERMRKNYLMRKASGKQQEYERRYAEKRKARYAEKRAAFLEQGAVLGSDSLALIPAAVRPTDPL